MPGCRFASFPNKFTHFLIGRSHFRNTFIFTFAKEQLTWKSFRILATIIDTPLIKRKIYQFQSVWILHWRWHYKSPERSADDPGNRLGQKQVFVFWAHLLLMYLGVLRTCLSVVFLCSQYIEKKKYMRLYYKFKYNMLLFCFHLCQKCTRFSCPISGFNVWQIFRTI